MDDDDGWKVMAIAHMDLKFRLAKRNNTNNVSISIKKKFNFMFMGKMHTHTGFEKHHIKVQM